MDKTFKILVIFTLVICLYFSCSPNKNNVVEGIGGTTTVECDNQNGYMGNLTYTCQGDDGSYALNTNEDGTQQNCGIKTYSEPENQNGYIIDNQNLNMPDFSVTATCNNANGWAVVDPTIAPGGSRPTDDTTGSSDNNTPYVLSGCNSCASLTDENGLSGNTGATESGCSTCELTQQSVTTPGVCSDCISPYSEEGGSQTAPIGVSDATLRAAGL